MVACVAILTDSRGLPLQLANIAIQIVARNVHNENKHKTVVELEWVCAAYDKCMRICVCYMLYIGTFPFLPFDGKRENNRRKKKEEEHIKKVK